MTISNISVFTVLIVCLFSQTTFGWIRFRYPYSRRVYIQQSTAERLQNCGGLKEKQCGVCGEGPGEIPTSTIPEQNYLPIILNDDMIDVEVAFHSDLGGYFQFRLCGIEPDMVESNRKCSETMPLQLIGDRSNYYPVTRQTSARLPVVFPAGTSCDICLLQVKYIPNKPAEGLGNFTYYDCAPVSLSSPTKQVRTTRVETALPSGQSTGTSRTITVKSSSVRGGDNSRMTSLLLGRTGAIDATSGITRRGDGQTINRVNAGGSARSIITSSGTTSQNDGQPARTIQMQNRTVVIRTQPRTNTVRATVHRLVINNNQPSAATNTIVNTNNQGNLQNTARENNIATNDGTGDISRTRTTRIEGITFAGDTLSGTRRGQIFDDRNTVDGGIRTDTRETSRDIKVITRGPTFTSRNITLSQDNIDGSVLTDTTLKQNNIVEGIITDTTVPGSAANTENTRITYTGNAIDDTNTKVISGSTFSSSNVNTVNSASNDVIGGTFSRRVETTDNTDQGNNLITRAKFLTFDTTNDRLSNNIIEGIGSTGSRSTMDNVNTGSADVTSGMSGKTINVVNVDRTITTNINGLRDAGDVLNVDNRLVTSRVYLSNGPDVDRTMLSGDSFSRTMVNGKMADNILISDNALRNTVTNVIPQSAVSRNTIDTSSIDRSIVDNTIRNANTRQSNTNDIIDYGIVTGQTVATNTNGRTAFDNGVIVDNTFSADRSVVDINTVEGTNMDRNMITRTTSTKTINDINIDRNVDVDRMGNIVREINTPIVTDVENTVLTNNTLSQNTIIDVGVEGNVNTDNLPINEVSGGSTSNSGTVFVDASRNNVGVNSGNTDRTSSIRTGDVLNGGRTVVTTFGRISKETKPNRDAIASLSNKNVFVDNSLLLTNGDTSMSSGRIDPIVNEGLINQGEITFVNNQDNLLQEMNEGSTFSSSVQSTKSDVSTISDRTSRQNEISRTSMVDDRSFRTVDRQESLADILARMTGSSTADRQQQEADINRGSGMVETVNQMTDTGFKSGGTVTVITVNKTINGQRASTDANNIGTTFIDRFGVDKVTGKQAQSSTSLQNEGGIQSSDTLTSGLIGMGQSTNTITNNPNAQENIASENYFFNEYNLGGNIESGLNTRTDTYVDQSGNMDGAAIDLYSGLIGNTGVKEWTTLGEETAINNENFSSYDVENTSSITQVSYIDSGSINGNDSALSTNVSGLVSNFNESFEMPVYSDTVYSNVTYHNNTVVDVMYANESNRYDSIIDTMSNQADNFSTTDIISSNSSESNVVLLNETYLTYESTVDSNNFTLNDSFATNIKYTGSNSNYTIMDTEFVNINNIESTANIGVNTTNNFPQNEIRGFYEFESTTIMPDKRDFINTEQNAFGKFQQEVVSVPNTITVFPIDFKNSKPIVTYTESPVDTKIISKHIERHATVYDDIIISSNNNQLTLSDNVNSQLDIRPPTTEIPLPINRPIPDTVTSGAVQTIDPFDIYFQNFETSTIPAQIIDVTNPTVQETQTRINPIDKKSYETIEMITYNQQHSNGNGQKIAGADFILTQTDNREANMVQTIDTQVNSSLVTWASNETSEIITNLDNVTFNENIIVNRNTSNDTISSLETSTPVNTGALFNDISLFSTELPRAIYDKSSTTVTTEKYININDWQNIAPINTDQHVGDISTLRTNKPIIYRETSTTAYEPLPSLDKTTPKENIIAVETKPSSVVTVPTRPTYERPSTSTSFPEWTFDDIYSTTTVPPPKVDLLSIQTESVASLDTSGSAVGTQQTNFETVAVKDPNNIYISGDSVTVVNVSKTTSENRESGQYADLVNNVDMYGGIPITGTNGQRVNRGTFFVSSKSSSSNSVMQPVGGSSFDVTNSLIPIDNRPIVDDTSTKVYDSKSVDSSGNILQSDFVIYNTTSSADITFNRGESTYQDKQRTSSIGTDMNNIAENTVNTMVNSNIGNVDKNIILETTNTAETLPPISRTTSVVENSLVNGNLNTINLGSSVAESNLFDQKQTSIYSSDLQNDMKSKSPPIATSTIWRSIGLSGDNAIVNNKMPTKTWSGDINDPMSYHFFTLVNGDSNTQLLGSRSSYVGTPNSVDITNTYKPAVISVDRTHTKQNVVYRQENVSSNIDTNKGNKNLTSSTLWDLNRMNNGMKVENTASSIEYKPTSSVTTIFKKTNKAVKPAVVTRSRRYRVLVDRQVPQVMPPITARDTRVNIVSQYQSPDNTEKSADLNVKVLETLEQLVLELKQNQDINTSSNIPAPVPIQTRLNSTIAKITSFEPSNKSTYQINPINAMNVLYVDEGISKGIPPPIIPGYKETRTASINNSNRRGRLSNLKAASEERQWIGGFESSQIKLEPMNVLNQKGPKNEVTTVKQSVITLPNRKGRMYDILLGKFANVSTVNIGQVKATVEATLDSARNQQMQTSSNRIETTTNSFKLEKPTQEINNADLSIKDKKELLRKQIIVQASDGQISNPFAGTNILLDSNVEKTMANQVSVDPQYRDAPTADIADIKRVDSNIVSKDPLFQNTNQIAIEGKYYIGEMRRNEYGQFEPVPVGADVALKGRDTVAPSIGKSNTVNIIKVTKNVEPSQSTKTKFVDNQKTTVDSNIKTKFISQDKLLELINQDQLTSRLQNTILETVTSATTSINEDVQRLPNSLSSNLVPKAEFCGQGQRFVCKAVGSHEKVPGMVWWCFSHCKNGVCPEEKCKCSCETVSQAKPIDTTTKSEMKARVKKVINLTLNGTEEAMVPVENKVSQQPPSPKFEITVLTDRTEPNTLNESSRKGYVPCRGINAFARTKGIDKWCTTMCSRNVCPPEICAC